MGTMTKIEAVYIAASSSDMDRAQHWANHLGCAGIQCTSAWMKNIADECGGQGNPRGVEREKRALWSSANLAAIDSSQLLWYLVPPPTMTTCGAWWEAGHANATKKIVICSGVDTEVSVFCALGQEYKDDLTAFATICRLAREGAWSR